MSVQESPTPAFDRGIHPLHLLAFVAAAALAGPVMLYALFLVLFLLIPGGLD